MKDELRTERTALITGASRGLGLALARALAKRGWNLITHRPRRRQPPHRTRRARDAAHTSRPSPATSPIPLTGARSPSSHADTQDSTRSSTTPARSDQARSPGFSIIRSTCSTVSSTPTSSHRLDVLQAVRGELKPGSARRSTSPATPA